MEQRTNFLALMLLDALEDENELDIFSMLERNHIDASFVPRDRGIAPIHYVCGMQNTQLALKIMKQFLQNGADVNVRCDGNMTPLHIAAIYGRVDIIRVLLEHGACVDLRDDENNLPLHYAIEECHFDVLQLMRDHIFLQKHEKKKLAKVNQQKLTQSKFEQQIEEGEATSTPNKNDKQTECINKQLLTITAAHKNDDSKYTPNQIHYNYDVTSPYYIHITHRRHKPQPKFPDSAEQTPEAVNLFTLTKENLIEMTHSASIKEKRSRMSLIEAWRVKVEKTHTRQSLLQKYEGIAQLVEQGIYSDDFNFGEHQKTTATAHIDPDNNAHTLNEENEQIADTAINRLALNDIVQDMAKAQILESKDSSYHTAPEVESTTQQQKAQLLATDDMDRQQLIRSPKMDQYFLQVTEAYVHTDDENGLVFYETKLLNNLGNKVAQQALEAVNNKVSNMDVTATSHSTNYTLPIDYETDDLRAELTQFGERVGPITKSTKKLYIKRLVKYKRNTAQMLALRKHAQSNQIKYSVELQRTLRSQELFNSITNYFTYETTSAAHFVAHNPTEKQLREGHIKQSFIYMLIDPRMSCNLPGESVYLDKLSTWQRFLDAIFYVGKGKSSRPYAHLYEAMKVHSRTQQKPETCSEATRKKISIKEQNIPLETFKSSSVLKHSTKTLNKKLQRILDIWRMGQGVVCLHVFHNIMPTDAYTREAAIIDALGLKHLTNLKRGDYYGPANAWTMKEKKYFGIALLYKAMQIFLAEGESQLSPSDLI